GTDTLRDVEAVRGTLFHDVFNALGFGLAGALNVGSTFGSFNDFAGSGGDDTVIGNGNTRINYSIATGAGISVDLEDPTNLVNNVANLDPTAVAGFAIGLAGSNQGTDTLTGVNAVLGSMFDDHLLGSRFNNTFTGIGGNDF